MAIFNYDKEYEKALKKLAFKLSNIVGEDLEENIQEQMLYENIKKMVAEQEKRILQERRRKTNKLKVGE